MDNSPVIHEVLALTEVTQNSPALHQNEKQASVIGIHCMYIYCNIHRRKKITLQYGSWMAAPFVCVGIAIHQLWIRLILEKWIY